MSRVAFVPLIKNSELNVCTCACVLALDCRNFGSGLHACVTEGFNAHLQLCDSVHNEQVLVLVRVYVSQELPIHYRV